VSNFEAWLDDLLVDLDVRDLFDVRVISGIEGIEKPDPRIYELALSRAAVEANEVVYVGDIPEFDVDPPAALGMFPVLIDRRQRHADHVGARITDLADSCRTLKQGIIQRRTLKESGELSQELLRESRGLQKHLQNLTHQVLSAEEDHRKEISHELQDEIAQTLLGINVRLLALKHDAAANAHGFEAEIASTERLLDVSVKSIKRFAREIVSPHRAHLTRRQPHGENT
jgi:signal transduction histidine kinase